MVYIYYLTTQFSVVSAGYVLEQQPLAVLWSRSTNSELSHLRHFQSFTKTQVSLVELTELASNAAALLPREVHLQIIGRLQVVLFLGIGFCCFTVTVASCFSRYAANSVHQAIRSEVNLQAMQIDKSFYVTIAALRTTSLANNNKKGVTVNADQFSKFFNCQCQIQQNPSLKISTHPNICLTNSEERSSFLPL